MRYEGALYRPPSEARSLIVQIAIGCAHNDCTFCSMYKDKKFRIRKVSEVIEDLKEARSSYRYVKRIFLADGNALILKIEDLRIILRAIKELFPECERVGIYSAPRDILNKSLDELKELKELGLGIAYLGIESGSDKILKDIKKGVTSEEMIQAGKKMVASGIRLSVMIISGLGGKELFEEHARESARVVNEINPSYVALLTLLVNRNTEMYDKVQSGELVLLSPKEVIQETKLFLENLNLSNATFRSNHSSNYVALAGVLPQDKDMLISKLDRAMDKNFDHRAELYRRL